MMPAFDLTAAAARRATRLAMLRTEKARQSAAKMQAVEALAAECRRFIGAQGLIAEVAEVAGEVVLITIPEGDRPARSLLAEVQHAHGWRVSSTGRPGEIMDGDSLTDAIADFFAGESADA